MNLLSWVRSDRFAPAGYHANFVHLYFDMMWYGVLAASAMSFVAIYAARLGASTFQIGLLGAGPAIVNIAFTLPAGRWLTSQPIDLAVFRAASLSRFFYLLWVPLPWLLGARGQIWMILSMTLLMSLPGTVLAVGFNSLFADAVPPDWRGHVVGIRNALLSVIFIVFSLLCGQILTHMPFPAGYQIVFAIGFVGAAMSTLHLRLVVPNPAGQPQPRVGRGLGNLAHPGGFRPSPDALRAGSGLRFLLRRPRPNLLRTEILHGNFGRLMLVLFAFHLTVNLAVPLFAPHWVNQIHLTDREIGVGTAVFYASVFLGSTLLDTLTRKLGNQRVTAIGALFMSLYPAFMALAQGPGLFLVGSAAGGLGWSLVGGALINYLLEKAPADDRPTHLAWYNLILNAAVLLGSLAGPFLAGLVTVPIALGVFAVLRVFAAVWILVWE